MIATFFGQEGLGSSAALALSLLIGFGFGVALEQAGFGSSRRLAEQQAALAAIEQLDSK